MTILLAGSTGLVGRKLLSVLLDAGQSITSVGRRPSGIEDDKLVEMRVDFAAMPPLPAADTAICTLGTTMAQAGSEAAFRAVDHGAVMAFFSAARAAGVPHAIVITAIGSSVAARAFYSRVKGEAERDILALGFARVDIVRPGLILGPRPERRPAEALAQRAAPFLNPFFRGPLEPYGAIHADIIAAAIAALAGEPGAGRFVHTNRELRDLAKTTASA